MGAESAASPGSVLRNHVQKQELQRPEGVQLNREPVWPRTRLTPYQKKHVTRAEKLSMGFEKMHMLCSKLAHMYPSKQACTTRIMGSEKMRMI